MREYIVLTIPILDMGEVKTIMDSWPVNGVYDEVVSLEGQPVHKKENQEYYVISLDAERIDKKAVKDISKWFEAEKLKLAKASMIEIVSKPSAKLMAEGYTVPVVEEVQYAK